ncbi:MAG: N-acetylglucosamine kinase [Candidatus Nealsonbacteria bacterium]
MKTKKQKPSPEFTEGYVIGVDGGGTKTITALANLEGKILKIARAGSSSPRNIGIKKATDNVAKAINKLLKQKKDAKIISTFIGLPAVAEEFKSKKKEIKKEISKKVPEIFKGKVEIGSDQEVAFRSGSDQKDGVLVIAGTGSVVRGWKGKRQLHVSAWGWLADEGSAFFVGQKTFQVIFKDLDGRGPKTLLTKLTFKELKLRKKEDLVDFIYSKNPTVTVPLLSIICDKASKRGDKIAKEIMVIAAQELVLGAKLVIKKLKLESLKFPLVLVGGIFKSKIVLNRVKKEIKKIAPKVKFILPKKAPVIGAVKLAIERM